MDAAAPPAGASVAALSGRPVTFLSLLRRFVVVADREWEVALWDLATREMVHRDLSFQQHVAAGAPPLSVPTLRGAPAEELTRLVAAGVPFIDASTLGTWAAAAWTLDGLCAEPRGQIVVPVTFPTKRGQGRRFGGCERTRDVELRTFVQSFDALRAEAERQQCPPPYLRAWSFEKAGCEDLRRDYDPPAWATDWFDRFRPQPQRPDFQWLFVGPAGARTPLHIDPALTHAWLAQVQGRKRWLLVPPHDAALIVDRDGFCDLEAPDPARFPRAAEARQLELVLSPGEILFVPQGWAHQVVSLDHGLSITHNFLPEKDFRTVRLACLRHLVRPTVPAAGVPAAEAAPPVEGGGGGAAAAQHRDPAVSAAGGDSADSGREGAAEP